MSQADELNVEDESTQSGAFPVCQTGWIKNGCEQSLAIKELQITDNHLLRKIGIKCNWPLVALFLYRLDTGKGLQKSETIHQDSIKPHLFTVLLPISFHLPLHSGP